MENFTKVVEGFVRQHFEMGPGGKFVCVDQEFIVGDASQIEYVEDFWGDTVTPPDYIYQAYNMVVEPADS